MNTKFLYIPKNKYEKDLFHFLLLYMGLEKEASDLMYDYNYVINLNDEILPLLVDKNEISFGNIIVPFTSYADIAWCINHIDFILQDKFAYRILSCYRPEFFFYEKKIHYTEISIENSTKNEFKVKSGINEITVINDDGIRPEKVLINSAFYFYSSNPYERLIFIWGLLNMDFEEVFEKNITSVVEQQHAFAYFSQAERYIVSRVTSNKMFNSFLNIIKEIES